MKTNNHLKKAEKITVYEHLLTLFIYYDTNWEALAPWLLSFKGLIKK